MQIDSETFFSINFKSKCKDLCHTELHQFRGDFGKLHIDTRLFYVQRSLWTYQMKYLKNVKMCVWFTSRYTFAADFTVACFAIPGGI